MLVHIYVSLLQVYTYIQHMAYDKAKTSKTKTKIIISNDDAEKERIERKYDKERTKKN